MSLNFWLVWSKVKGSPELIIRRREQVGKIKANAREEVINRALAKTELR